MELFKVYPIHDVAIVRAEGSWLWDEQGTQYLDMYGGHAVISIGHTHPAYVGAVESQLHRIGFYSNSVIIRQQQAFADALGKLSGHNDYQLFIVNSGAEANENALKLASFHNGRSRVIAFKGSFHGRTSLAVAATDNPAIVAPVNRTDHVTFLPFNDITALEAEFAEHGGQISSVIVEGIQGVGGIRVATNEFLQAIRRLCTQYGAVYIADSVQCGCGRTGTYYSHDRAGASADIYTMAKGIGNGFPIGALAIAPHLKPTIGMLGTTFGGNQLACVAATAVAQTIHDEGLMDNAVEVGGYIMEQLQGLPGVREVRGRGLMIGIEMEGDTAPLRSRLLHEEHIFVGASGKNVIRLLPALSITKGHADYFLNAFRKLLTEAC